MTHAERRAALAAVAAEVRTCTRCRLHETRSNAVPVEGHPDTEVHVVLSIRDLVRQIPAEWQENVKHRRELPYARFLAQLRDPARDSAIGSWFWGVQEVPDILDRWAAELPPERSALPTGEDDTVGDWLSERHRIPLR